MKNNKETGADTENLSLHKENKAFQKHQGELSGNIPELSGTYLSQRKKEIKEHEAKEKNRKFHDALMAIFEQLYKSLKNRIKQDLSKVRQAMHENRAKWELHANRLNDIDDLLEEVKSGRDLNKDKARALITKAGKTLPEHATTADYLLILNTIKCEDLEAIEGLDIAHGNLEQDESMILQAGEQAAAIHNDETLSEAEKERQLTQLHEEYTTQEWHSEAMNEKDGQEYEALEQTKDNNFDHSEENALDTNAAISMNLKIKI